MGQIRHGSATIEPWRASGSSTMARARRQSSNTAIASFARATEPGAGVNPKTMAKWRKRATVEDRKTGPTESRSTVLAEHEEAIIVAFRRHTLLPLDDCLYALQLSIPHLTRSALHCCLQRHGISRLPDVDGDKPNWQRFKRNPIGPRQRFLNRWRTRRLDPRRHRRGTDGGRKAPSCAACG